MVMVRWWVLCWVLVVSIVLVVGLSYLVWLKCDWKLVLICKLGWLVFSVLVSRCVVLWYW